MAHGIVVVENMSGTHNGVDLVSVRYAPGGTKTAIDNGNVVLVGALEAGSREVYVGATPAADSPKANLALVAAPEVQYDERLAKDLGNFFNEANAVIRGYLLDKPHQWFALTGEALDGGTARVVGAVIEAQAGTKLKAAATLTSGSTQVGVLRDIYVKKGITYYGIETV